MRKIARELNLSETAFVLPSDKATFQLRYFTPTGHEITFCGHSTVGALYMIGKPWIYGLAARGEVGVSEILNILQNELKIAMIHFGTHSIREINKDLIQPNRGF